MPHDYELEHFEHAGLWVRVVQDADASNPHRDCDDVGTLAAWDNTYDLWDEKIERGCAWDFLLGLGEQFKPDMAELLEALREDLLWKFIEEHYVILGISFQDWGSGGMRLKIDSDTHAPDSGWIYCTKTKALEECGSIENAVKCLTAEVATINQYLEGDVWGYGVFENEDGDWPDDLDSCWGFYGSDYAVQCAKEAAEYCAENRERERQRAALADQSVFNYCAL